MNLPEFSVKKKVTIVMVTIGLVLLGLISFFRLPQELFPPLVFPQITVVTEYANAAPEEIETLITKPIEETLSSLSGLKELQSVSREGRSIINIAFNWGQDIDFAALAVREKIDLVKERLPKEAEDPVVLKFDPLTRPVMILSVTGENLEPVQLKLLTEKILRDNLEKIEGVASARVAGGLDREILVEIDQGRLQANHLSLLQVVDSIEKANVSYPAGSIKKGLYEYLIRTMGEFRSVREIQFAVAGVDTVKKIRREDTNFLERGDEGPRQTLDALRQEIEKKMLEKRLVLVRDIGRVIDGFAEKTSVSRFNESENISIAIQKQAGANSIRVVDDIRKVLKILETDLSSKGIRYEIVYDHSTFIRHSLQNLLIDSLQGAFLAFLVLFLFLRAWLPSLLVTISIPITVMGIFFLMALNGITLNIMSLGGIALGVGMIVDTSIVVLENIFRRRQLGDDAETGAIHGANEVLWPVISSNLTTIAVFFPLIVFVPGIPGQLFKDLSWTVIYSQIIATVLPLTVVTMLSTYLHIPKKEYQPINVIHFFEHAMIEAAPDARRQNRFLLQLCVTALAIFIGALMLFPMMEKEVLPKVDQGQFLIKADMPIGTRLEVTDGISQKIEAVTREIPEVKDIAVTIGSEKSKTGEIKVESLRMSQAIILVTLEDKRRRSSADIVAQLEEKIKGLDLGFKELSFVVQESEFAFAEGGSKPVLIEVRGFDMPMMQKLVQEVENGLKKIPGIYNVTDDMSEASPETKLDINKQRAALYGISALDISLTAKAGIEGVVATQYREAGKEFDIRARLSEKDRTNTENLNSLLIYSQVLDSLIPLKEVATVIRGFGPSEIRRSNQERTTVVSADIQKSFKSKDVLKKVQKLLKGLDIPQDFQVVLSGKAKEVKENFSKIIFAFILSVILVYMIMASQFESFLQPLIIMFTVPLAIIGVAIALWVTGTSINVISLLGIVLLVGVVVNNGIVLIEYMNQLRESGLDLVPAVLEAVKIRTRPILMSSLTTVVALIPLAIGLGEGAELRSPLAIAVMGGLTTSTFLTLLIIPSLYILVTRWTEAAFGQPDDEEVN